jgi:GNAT superfamily N-acetyltransferase
VITVRRAAPGDAAALVALADQVAREEEGWILRTDGWRSVGEERRYLKAARSHPDAAVLVAEVDGRIVARLSLARDSHPASRHVADLGLMVDAGYRRRGIGTRLLGEAVEWAQASGVSKLELPSFRGTSLALAPTRRSIGGRGHRSDHLPGGGYVDAIPWPTESSTVTLPAVVRDEPASIRMSASPRVPALREVLMSRCTLFDTRGFGGSSPRP